MPEAALSALYRAVRNQLVGANKTEIWADRIVADEAFAGIPRPLVVMAYVADTEPLWSRVPGDLITLYVQCITNDPAQQMDGGGRIRELLHDAGVSDSPITTTTGYTAPPKLAGGTYWAIMSATWVQTVRMIENVQGARPIYHDGGRIQFRVERI